MKLQLQVIVITKEEEEGELIETAQEHSKIHGGAPEMIETAGAALIELLEFRDAEGFEFTEIPGATIESFKFVVLCSSPECSRREHV